MNGFILEEKHYKETMDQTVVPCLAERRTVLWAEREAGRRIYCARYLTGRAKGVILISHGFTETAEKYLECIYYFIKEGYHVYCMDHGENDSGSILRFWERRKIRDGSDALQWGGTV